MKSYIPIYLYGFIIIAEGINLIISNYSNLVTLKLTLGIGLIIGGILAFITALSRQKRQVQFAYHEMHGLAMLVYGICLLAFCNTLDMILYFTTFLLIFYAFSEFIFCFWLFNLEEKVNYKIIFIRVSLGLLTGIGTVYFMQFSHTNINNGIAGFGVLFILIGLNVIFYTPVMKRIKE